MRATTITMVETNVDRAASALFAGACGYAAFTWLGMRTGMPLLAVEAVAAVGAAYWLSSRALKSVRRDGRKAPLSVFDLRALEEMEARDELLLLDRAEPDELLLTEQREPANFDENPFERAERRLLEHYKSAPEPDPEPAVVVALAAGPEATFAPVVEEAPEQHAEGGEEPLLLDDVLAELGPDSRVVNLFDPEAMPTPGQLKSRIDRHIGPGEFAQSADAGQALHEALAELRRSMR
jgi:hypothetical protein